MAREKGGRSLEKDLLGYDQVLTDLVALLKESRRAAARSVNAVMTATYWLVGRRIVEQEQQGEERAGYGKALIERLSSDLSKRFGRGFGRRNLFQMRAFYTAYREIAQTPSALSPTRAEPKGKVQTPSALSTEPDLHGPARRAVLAEEIRRTRRMLEGRSDG